VPVKAVALQGIISGILVLSGTFDQILTYMGFSLGIFPLFAVLGVFKLRKSKNFYRSPGYPLAPIIYMLFGFSMLALAFFERPVESSVAVGTVLLGLPAFWLFNKQR
jgi:APA family basic amino acid/polyamine antiporter